MEDPEKICICLRNKFRIDPGDIRADNNGCIYDECKACRSNTKEGNKVISTSQFLSYLFVMIIFIIFLFKFFNFFILFIFFTLFYCIKM